MKKLSFLLLILFSLSGCDIQKRERALQEKETELAHKKQQLLEREAELNLKETELRQKQQVLDSTATQLDSVIMHHPGILGQWNVVMTCTETTCPGSAVGDTKTENWEISHEQNHIIAKAKTGNRLSRIYTGKNTAGKVIELTNTVEPTGDEPDTKMIVRLRIKDASTLEGKREILRESGCRIVYTLKLTR